MDRDKSERKSKKSQERSGLTTAWLLLFNVSMVAGWTSIGCALFSEMVTGNGNYKILYHNVERQLLFFQTGAILEILHSAVGIVPSSAILTAFQVFSRVLILWGVMYPIVKVQINLGCALCLFAWTITEIIRYSFYAFNLLGYMPYAVVYLRYTLFIVLYPIGVTGELLSIIRALPIVKQTELYTLHMPNKWNISVEYYYILWALFPLYVTVFPQLYFHMFKQRGKALGHKSRSKESRVERASVNPMRSKQD